MPLRPLFFCRLPSVMKVILTFLLALPLGIVSCGAQEEALRFTATPENVREIHDAFACELSFDLGDVTSSCSSATFLQREHTVGSRRRRRLCDG